MSFLGMTSYPDNERSQNSIPPKEGRSAGDDPETNCRKPVARKSVLLLGLFIAIGSCLVWLDFPLMHRGGSGASLSCLLGYWLFAAGCVLVLGLLWWLGRWSLSSRRNLLRSLAGVGVLVVLLACFYAIEDWRARSDWLAYNGTSSHF